MTLSGSCICGQVKYEVNDEFEFMINCHCSQCRKFSGSAFSTVGRIDEEKFKVISGSSVLGHHKVSEDTTRVFCNVCGASLYAQKPGINKIHLRMGSLDDCPSVRPMFHVHTASKAPWYEITDKLAQYETVPPEIQKS